MSAKKLPRSGSRNRVVRAGGVLSIGGLSSDSCGSKKKQLSMTRLELEGEEEGLKVSVDDAGTAAEVVYEEEIFEEYLDDEEDRPAETVEEERIRRRMGSGRRNRGIPLAANVGESINYDCSAQLTERGGADGLEADINDVSLVHFPAPPADDERREWAPEKKPQSEDIVDKIVAEDGAVRKKVGGEQRSSSECQEDDGISSTDFPTAGQMVQGVSLGEGATSKYAILGGRGGGRGEEAEEERGEGAGGREGSGAEGGSSGGSSGGGSGGRGGGKAPLEKKVKGPVSGGPYSSSGKADGGNRGWGDRGGSKPAAGEKSGKKKTGENKENRGAGSSSSLLAQPEAEGKTEKKLVVKPGAIETAAEAAEAAVAHRARTVDSPVPRRSQVSGEASAQMGVCEEESIEGMPPKPKSTELRADVATFACRLGLGGRETESLRGVDIGDKEAAAMVHGLRKNRDIQLLDLSDSSIRGEAAELLSSVLGSAAVPVPKLKSLVFARCPIGDSVAEVIFGCLARLEIASLDMRCTLLSPSAGQSLSKVIGANTACKLQNLNLSGNSLLSTGAAYIGSALSQCSSLTVLNLDGNGIDDSGALNLANGIKANSSLHTLLVANNEIGNAGGMALVQCWQERQKRMRVIDMSGNNLSGKVMGEIQKIGKNVVRVSK